MGKSDYKHLKPVPKQGEDSERKEMMNKEMFDIAKEVELKKLNTAFDRCANPQAAFQAMNAIRDWFNPDYHPGESGEAGEVIVTDVLNIHKSIYHKMITAVQKVTYDDYANDLNFNIFKDFYHEDLRDCTHREMFEEIIKYNIVQEYGRNMERIGLAIAEDLLMKKAQEEGKTIK